MRVLKLNLPNVSMDGYPDGVDTDRRGRKIDKPLAKLSVTELVYQYT